MQNETLGHRGRRDDPLYRIRKLLLIGSERLNERGRDRMLLSLRAGDPNDEVVGAWAADAKRVTLPTWPMIIAAVTTPTPRMFTDVDAAATATRRRVLGAFI